MVTTAEGEVLDDTTFQVPADTRAIAYRAIPTSMSPSGLYDVLTTGDLSKLPDSD